MAPKKKSAPKVDFQIGRNLRRRQRTPNSTDGNLYIPVLIRFRKDELRMVNKAADEQRRSRTDFIAEAAVSEARKFVAGRKKSREDVNQASARIVREATE